MNDRLTLAHEALLTHWGKLRAWVAEEREERILREDLAQTAALWARSGDTDLLWRRRRLLLMQEILRKRGVRLEGDEAQFFRASLWAMRRVRLAGLALGFVVLLAALGGLRAYAYMLELRTEKAQAEAKADSAVEEARRKAQAEAARLIAEAEERAAAIRAEAQKVAETVRRAGNARADTRVARARNRPG